MFLEDAIKNYCPLINSNCIGIPCMAWVKEADQIKDIPIPENQSAIQLVLKPCGHCGLVQK
jgi:hypothetical protein